MRPEVEVAVCSIARCGDWTSEMVTHRAIDVLRAEEHILGTVESEDEPTGCSEYYAEEQNGTFVLIDIWYNTCVLGS